MSRYLFNDSHIHLTNYVQEGPDIHDYLKMMGSTSNARCCSDCRCSKLVLAEMGDVPPTYYMQADAPLYYYSFTDAYIAMQFRSLNPKEQARFEPLISGFNPADMSRWTNPPRVQDIPRRVLRDRRVLDLQGVRFVQDRGRKSDSHQSGSGPHHGILPARWGWSRSSTPNRKALPQAGSAAGHRHCRPKELFKRHRKTKIIWAHVGLDESSILWRTGGDHRTRPQDPDLEHVYFDISWDEVAKYAVESAESAQAGSRRDQPPSASHSVRHGLRCAKAPEVDDERVPRLRSNLETPDARSQTPGPVRKS